MTGQNTRHVNSSMVRMVKFSCQTKKNYCSAGGEKAHISRKSHIGQEGVPPHFVMSHKKLPLGAKVRFKKSFVNHALMFFTKILHFYKAGRVSPLVKRCPMIEVTPWLELFTPRVLQHKGKMRKPQLALTQMSLNGDTPFLLLVTCQCHHEGVPPHEGADIIFPHPPSLSVRSERLGGSF